MLGRVLVGSTLLLALGAAFYALLDRGKLRFNHPGHDEFPVMGVDVSHHQGAIDWSRVRRANQDFAYLKATEGAAFRDPRLRANWDAARAAGLVPGAYHFYSLCKGGTEQAANFVDALAGLRGPALPPALDLEFGGNCTQRPAPADLARQVALFLQQVEAATGCRPLIYTTQDFHAAYLTGRFGHHELWVRNVFRRPRLEAGRRWRFWQFANRGQVDGVTGFVDLDAFDGGVREFEARLCR
jgi:lysozyme